MKYFFYNFTGWLQSRKLIRKLKIPWLFPDFSLTFKQFSLTSPFKNETISFRFLREFERKAFDFTNKSSLFFFFYETNDQN